MKSNKGGYIDDFEFLGIVAILGGALILGAIIGTKCTKKEIYKQAITNGAGHYTVDAEGKTSFQWNTSK